MNGSICRGGIYPAHFQLPLSLQCREGINPSPTKILSMQHPPHVGRILNSECRLPSPPPDTYNRDWNRRGGVYPRPALNPPILPLGVIPREVPQAPIREICGGISQHASDFSIDPSIRFQLHPSGFAVTSRSLGMTSVNRRAINPANAGGATYMRAGACGSRRRPGSVAPPALIPTTHISRAAERRKMMSLGREPQVPGEQKMVEPLEGATDCPDRTKPNPNEVVAPAAQKK